MIVVSDTSPLNYLLLIRQAGLLPILFGGVLIPPAVLDELRHPRAPSAVRDFAAHRPDWLGVRPPSNAAVAAVIRASGHLGAGESEAIALAIESHADLLLVDERRATREARTTHGLRATGVLGVLEIAANRSLVRLPEVLDALSRTTYRMPRDVMLRLLNR